MKAAMKMAENQPRPRAFEKSGSTLVSRRTGHLATPEFVLAPNSSVYRDQASGMVIC